MAPPTRYIRYAGQATNLRRYLLLRFTLRTLHLILGANGFDTLKQQWDVLVY